jgi:dipeptide/tripeptide permease
MSGVWLISAAACFWLTWALMPGVGVTDPREIFALVQSQRQMVMASVVLQLLSAVLYVPALLGLVTDRMLGDRSAVRWGAGLLIVGAMGSAADAILHLLAFAMTAPDVNQALMLPVMAFMQNEGLVLLAPMLAAFFVGGAWLAYALADAGVVSRWNGHLHLAALPVLAAGGAMAGAHFISARMAGLAFLGVVSAAQVLSGFGLFKRSEQ